MSSSSNPQLWATASKDWVILPKSKPGRKPKKDVAPVQTDELDSKGRRVQNRAAQRAFRERKQSQLADLQARVQSYEQGEIERNVALQNIAKRLKEENEMLRRENALLKERLAKAEERDIPRDSERKRWRDNSPASSVASIQRKKYKVDHEQVSRFAASYMSSPQSMVSSPESSSDSRFPSVSFDAQVDFAAFSNLKSESSSYPTFDCGFCSDGAPCVCRDVFQQASGVPEHKINVTPVRSIVLGSPPPEETSILDNLPPYQPPVPLRLRPRNGAQINTIFQVSPPSQSTPANCSGDPSNCPACADDSFGKAFCERISEISTAPCDNCPSSEGMPEVGLPLQHPVAIPLPPQPSSSFTETIPTNDAWQRLKSHPNVAFADLAMLADVVVRRAKCTGPHAAPSPSPQPERVATPPVAAAGSESEQPVLLTDPHAHFHEKERARASRSPPRQDMCGQRRIREVPAEGVRDALRLLDAKFQ